MHVGVQGMSTAKIDLQFLRRHGVTHMNGGVEDMEVETLVQHREAAAAEGISFEATHVGVGCNITLARDPERDRELDEFCRMIENAGRAGLRALFYNFCIVDHQRTEDTFGRGGSRYSSFDMSKYDNDALTEAGRVDRDEAFARGAYFL